MVRPICLGAYLEQKLKGIPSIWNENATPDQVGPQLLILGTLVVTAACALHARYPNLKERSVGEQWNLTVTALNLIPDMERRRRLVDLVLEVFALIPSFVFKHTLVPLIQSARLVGHRKNANGAADDLLQSLTLHLVYKRDLPRVASILAHLSEKVYVAAFENQNIRLSKTCVDCLAELLHDVAIDKLKLRLPNKVTNKDAAVANDDKAVVTDGLLDILRNVMRSNARARSKAAKDKADRSPMLSDKTRSTISSALDLLGLDDTDTRQLVSAVFRELTAQLPRNMVSASDEQEQWERFSALTDEVMTLCDARRQLTSGREIGNFVPSGIENAVQRLSRLPDFADVLGEALAETLQQSEEDVDLQAIIKPLCDTLSAYARSQQGKKAAVLGESIALMANRAIECQERDNHGPVKMKQMVNLAYKLCDEVFLSDSDCFLPGTCPTEAKMAHRMTSNILRKLFMDRQSSSYSTSLGLRKSYAESATTHSYATATTHSHATSAPDARSHQDLLRTETPPFYGGPLHQRLFHTNTTSRSVTSSTLTAQSPRDVVFSPRMTGDVVTPREAVTSSMVNTEEAQRCMAILSGLGQIVPVNVLRRLSAEVFVQLGSLPQYILVVPGNSALTAEDHAIASWLAQNAECEFTLKAAAARVIRLAAKQVQERTKITDAIRLAIGDEKKPGTDATYVPWAEKPMTTRGGDVPLRTEVCDRVRASKDSGRGGVNVVDHSAVSRLEMLARRPLHLALVNPAEPCRVSKWALANVPTVVRELVQSTEHIDEFVEALSYKIAREQDVPRSVVFALDSLVNLVYDSMQQNATSISVTEQRRVTKQKVFAIFKERSSEIRELEVDRVAKWLVSQMQNALQWRTPAFEKEIETVVATSVSTSLARAMADAAVAHAECCEELLGVLHNEIMHMLTGYRITTSAAQRLLDRVVAEVPSSTLATKYLLKLARRVAQFTDEEEEEHRASTGLIDLTFLKTEKESRSSVEDFLTTLTERIVRQFTSVTPSTFTQLAQELQRVLGRKLSHTAESLQRSRTRSSRLGETDSSPHDPSRGVLNNLIAYAKQSRIGTNGPTSLQRASSSFFSVSSSLPHTLDGRFLPSRRGQSRVDNCDSDRGTINRALHSAPEFSEDVHERCASLGESLAEKIMLWMKVRNTPDVTQTASLVTAALRAARTSVEGIRAMIHLMSQTAVKHIVNSARQDHQLNADAGTPCGNGLKQSEAAYVEQVLTLIADDVFLMLINERDFSTEDTERLQRAFLDLKPLIRRTLYSDTLDASAYLDVPSSGRRSERYVLSSSPRTLDSSPFLRDERVHRPSVTLSISDTSDRMFKRQMSSPYASPVGRRVGCPADKSPRSTSFADTSSMSGAHMRKNKGARRKNFNIDSLIEKHDGDVTVDTNRIVASIEAVRDPTKRVNKARALMRDLTESVFKGVDTPDMESTKRATRVFEKLSDVVFDEALKTDTHDPVHNLNCQLARTNARNSWVRQMTTKLPGTAVDRCSNGDDDNDDDGEGMVVKPRMHSSESILIGEWMVDIWKQAMTESTNLNARKKGNEGTKGIALESHSVVEGQQPKDANDPTHLDMTLSSSLPHLAEGHDDSEIKLIEAEAALVNIASEKAIEVAVRRTGIKNPNPRDVRSSMAEVMEVVKGSFMGSLGCADPKARQRATRFLSSLEEEAISNMEKQTENEAWLPISGTHRSVYRNLIDKGEVSEKNNFQNAAREENDGNNISPQSLQSPKRLRGYNSLGDWYEDEPLSPGMASNLDGSAPVLRLTREPHSMEKLPPGAKMEDVTDDSGVILRRADKRVAQRKSTLHPDYREENETDLRQCAPRTPSAVVSAAPELTPRQMDRQGLIPPDHMLSRSRQPCCSKNTSPDLSSNAMVCARDNSAMQGIPTPEILGGSRRLPTRANDPFRMHGTSNVLSSPSPSRSRVSSADFPSPSSAFRHPVRSNPVGNAGDEAMRAARTSSGPREPDHVGSDGITLFPPLGAPTPNRQRMAVAKQCNEQQGQVATQHQVSLSPTLASSSAGSAMTTPAHTSKADVRYSASNADEEQQVNQLGRLLSEEVLRCVSTFRRDGDAVSTEISELVFRAMGHMHPHVWGSVKHTVDSALLSAGPCAVQLWEEVKCSVDNKRESDSHITTPILQVQLPARTHVALDPAIDEPVVDVSVGNLCVGDKVKVINDVKVVDRAQAERELMQATGEIRIYVSRGRDVRMMSLTQPSEMHIQDGQMPNGENTWENDGGTPALRLPLAPSQPKSPASSLDDSRASILQNSPRAGNMAYSPRSGNVLYSLRERGNPSTSAHGNNLSCQPCRTEDSIASRGSLLLPPEEKRGKSVSFSRGDDSLTYVDDRNTFPGPGTYLLFHNETRNFELHWCDRRPPADPAYTLLGFFSATKNVQPSSSTLDNPVVLCRRDRTDRKNVFNAWASFIRLAAAHAASQVFLLELDGSAQTEFSTKLAFKERKTQQIRLLRAGEESTLSFVDAGRVPCAVVALHAAHLVFDGVYSLDTAYFIEEGKDYGAVVEL